jgi:hypothetical protein
LSIRPAAKSPPLHNKFIFLELHVNASDGTIKDRESSSLFGADFGSTLREGSPSLLI